MLAVELIKKKRNGHELTDTEIQAFIQSYLQNEVTDYQMSALLMAIFFNGMSDRETLALTQAMLKSGDVIEFSDTTKFYVDKHSTGGVGDKTSLLLAPIVSCLGIPVPMISGRGLGHTGGTLDKLESIPGFNTQLSLTEFKNMVTTLNASLIGQTQNICPADKRIYALRDVTGTVESLPLICASIMSKKLAEGVNGLVLDVKFGSGAFMKSFDQAKALANGLIQIAKGANKKVTALLTNMNQPLGTFAGNSLEVQECLDILINPNRAEKPFHLETRDLSLELSAQMVKMALNCTYQEAFEKCQEALNSGQAFEQFQRIVKAQGGELSALPKPKNQLDVKTNQSGYLESFDLEKIGWLNVELGAGRKVLTDKIKVTSGIEFHAKIGSQLRSGDPVFSLYGDSAQDLDSLAPALLATLKFSQNEISHIDLIGEVLT